MHTLEAEVVISKRKKRREFRRVNKTMNHYE